jgi:hypothetical protein
MHLGKVLFSALDRLPKKAVAFQELPLETVNFNIGTQKMMKNPGLLEPTIPNVAEISDKPDFYSGPRLKKVSAWRNGDGRIMTNKDIQARRDLYKLPEASTNQPLNPSKNPTLEFIEKLDAQWTKEHGRSYYS